MSNLKSKLKGLDQGSTADNSDRESQCSPNHPPTEVSQYPIDIETTATNPHDPPDNIQTDLRGFTPHDNPGGHVLEEALSSPLKVLASSEDIFFNEKKEPLEASQTYSNKKPPSGGPTTPSQNYSNKKLSSLSVSFVCPSVSASQPDSNDEALVTIPVVSASQTYSNKKQPSGGLTTPSQNYSNKKTSSSSTFNHQSPQASNQDDFPAPDDTLDLELQESSPSEKTSLVLNMKETQTQVASMILPQIAFDIQIAKLLEEIKKFYE